MRFNTQRIGIAALICIPILANILPLLGVVQADPQLLYSGLQHDVVRGFLPGLPYIDPSGGSIYEPMAREALRQWLAGSIPWWNHYEGVGVPLAGGVIAGAFSPFLPFLLLPNGLLVQQIIAQIACGLLTFAALRLLKCPPFAALVGGALFQLNGTFAWLGFLWCHPVVSLPLYVVGLELLRRQTRRDSILGAMCLALATYIAIVASFLEIGYLDALLAVGWFLVRTSQASSVRGALRYAGWSSAGALTGLLLAAPQLAATLDAVKYGTSIHHSAGLGYSSLVGAAVPQFAMPYFWGPIFRYLVGDIVPLWDNVGGYLGIGPIVVASAVVCLRSERRLAGMLVAWIALTVGAQFGFSPALRLINLIPGVPFTAQYRYSGSSWEFATAILCGLLLAQWSAAGKPFLRPAHRIALGAIGLVFLDALFANRHQVTLTLQQPHYTFWLVGSLLLALLVIAAMVALMARSGGKAVGYAGILLVAEAFLYYFVPTLGYPRGGRVDLGMTRFLQEHVDDSRLYSMDWIGPNYGTYYRIPMINHDDPLLPRAWADYAMTKLDPYSISPLMFLEYRIGTRPSLADVFAWNRENFADVGVKYITALPSVALASYAPVVGGSQLPLALGRAGVAGSVSGIVGKRVDRLDVQVGTYGGIADGILAVRVCSGRACVRGRVNIIGLTDNDYADIPLSASLPLVGKAITFSIAQEAWTKPIAVWLFQRGSDNESLTKGPSDHFPHLRIYTDLATYVAPASDADNAAYPVGRLPLRITAVAPGAAVSILSVGVVQGTSGGRADGDLQIQVCSGGNCSSGVAPIMGSPDDDFIDVPLSRALAVTGPALDIKVSQTHSHHDDALWLSAEDAAFPQELEQDGKPLVGLAAKLRFTASYNPPVEVYRDELGSIFEVPGAKPYMEAQHCRLDLKSRDEVISDCVESSRLVRRELSYPGWSVSVDGTDAEPAADGLFQEVSLPKGHSVVRFRYQPAHEQAAFILWGLAVILLLTGTTVVVRR